MNSTNTLSIFTDGAARGNPGPAAAAFLFIQNEVIIHQQNYFLGNRTNNQAEYHAIIKALEHAISFTQETIALFSDSELVVKQLIGEYQVKSPHLKNLYLEVKNLAKHFSSVAFSHVPRTNSWIKLADKLCNETLNHQNR